MAQSLAVRVFRGQRGNDFWGFLLHAPTVKNALNIRRCGRITPGQGICGEGIYGFEVLPRFGSLELATTWKRCAAGCYNRGAAFLMRCGGVLVKSNHSDVVPPGFVGSNKDQFAASPGSVTYVGVTFSRDALL